MYEIFLVNFWVIKTHNFVSGLRTLKPKKPLKPLKPENLKNLKTFFLKNLGFSALINIRVKCAPGAYSGSCD